MGADEGVKLVRIAGEDGRDDLSLVAAFGEFRHCFSIALLLVCTLEAWLPDRLRIIQRHFSIGQEDRDGSLFFLEELGERVGRIFRIERYRIVFRFVYSASAHCLYVARLLVKLFD